MTADLVPFTVHPSRAKALLLLLVSLLFVGAGIFILTQKGGDWRIWTGVVFFGIGIPFLLLKLIPSKNALTVDREGLEMVTPFQRVRVPWQDLAGFGAYRIGVNSFVGLNYSAHYGEKSAGARKFARGLAGYEGALPDTYGFKAEQLAAILNQWLEAANHPQAGPEIS